MMMIRWRRWAICVCWFLTLGPCPPAPSEDELAATGLNLIKGILADPLWPKNVHRANVVSQGRDPRYGHPKYEITDEQGVLGWCSVRLLPDGNLDFIIQLWNNDTVECGEEPNWQEAAKNWKAFVQRHWPGFECVTDLEKEISRYRPGTGEFTMQYALKQQEVQVMRVGLEIRLADGKLGGVSLMDDRHMLGGQAVPPPPAKDEVLAAVLRKLLVWPNAPHVVELSPKEMNRYVERGRNGAAPRFEYSLDLRGQTAEGNTVVVIASYDESTREARILNVYDASELRTFSKPMAMVSDDHPAWSADGKAVYFSTTRVPKGFPWWQRGSIMRSMAVCTVEDGREAQVRCIRPLKQRQGDTLEYGRCVPSPSRRYLAGTLRQNRLFMLDDHAGIVYLPDRDEKWRQRTLEALGGPQFAEYLPTGLLWEVRGMAWLPDESGIIISLLKDRDTNLYLARWATGKPPQQMELVGVVVGPGDDLLPCLADDGSLLGHVRKARREETWELVVSDFDLVTCKPSRPRALPLDAEPMSLSWDAGGRRWLVVTAEEMLWIAESREHVLTATSVGELSWNGTPLTPTSAAVSPVGDTVAVAAALAPAYIGQEGTVRVESALFTWDGKSHDVHPMFGVDATDLPRWEYGNGQRWARISGDLDRFGLTNILDPAFAEPEPARPER